MRTYAPAKINLALDTFGKREDGFHEIATVFQTIGIYDIIDWTTDDSGKFEVNCPDTGLNGFNLNGYNNIVYRAAKAYFKFAGLPNKGFIANITKNIPIQAGLGGGSSDAAAIVMALAEKFRIFPPFEFYTTLGADVPFFTVRGTCLGQGIGEDLTPIDPPLKGIYAVIVQGVSRVSTVEAYKWIDHLHDKNPVYIQEMVDAICDQDYEDICKYCGNVFEQVAEKMEIWEISAIKASLSMNGADATCLTGSGSAVFGLFNDPQRALICQENLKKDFKFVRACQFI
jgi:4-diphosphocytidyl-2-C-methyl-D-erythritol kinase